MPSSVQPAHAPQNPVICWRESLVWTGGFTASSAIRVLFLGQEDNTTCQPAGLAGRIAAGGLKQQSHCGLHDFADRVARKRIHYEKAGRQFVSRQKFLGPPAKARQ